MQVVPCAVLALFIHPSTSHHLLNRIFWAFCVYLEAVSVLPQLRVMQNTKVHLFEFKLFYEPFFLFLFLFCFIWIDVQLSYIIYLFLYFQIVEPFTAHYVFALGVARFLSCAHWVLQVWSCKVDFICFIICLWHFEIEFAAYAVLPLVWCNFGIASVVTCLLGGEFW